MKYDKIINTKNCKYILSIFTIFILITLFDIAVYGLFVLSDIVLSVDNLWRDRAGIIKFLPLTIFVYLVLSITIVTLFKDFVTQPNEGALLMNFLKAGLLIGSLLGTVFLGFYIIFPINISLVSACFAGSLIFGISAGLILYFFNK